MARDDVGKNRREPVSHNFCNDLVGKIEKTYGPEVIKGGSIRRFRNQGNEEGGGGFQNLTRAKEILDGCNNRVATISQQKVKTQPENPSEPGALKFPSEKTACLIFIGSGIAKSCWF